METYSIDLRNVSKKYFSFKKILKIIFCRFRNPIKDKFKVHKYALEGIDLSICQGERVGIIGHNGAGKSTLLRVIAGLAEKSSGEVCVQGRVDCIMTLGVGLREEMSGRENIVIDGELSGKTAKEISETLDEITAFAELAEFIDRPVRTYSSGMKARLAFAMITCMKPEILIIDEALSAGDAQFSQKASAKIKEICSHGKILIIVSHSMSTIVDMCDRCIWLDSGKIVMDGDSKTVTDAYLNYMHERQEEKFVREMRSSVAEISHVDGIFVRNCNFYSRQGTAQYSFNVGDSIFFQYETLIDTAADIKNIEVFFELERSDGLVILRHASKKNGAPGLQAGRSTWTIDLSSLQLGKSSYYARITCCCQKTNKILAQARTFLTIENEAYPHENPVTWRPAEWHVTGHHDMI